MKIKNISLLQAIAVLIGTIIGAGMFGIPYAVKTAGLIPGLVLLLVLTVAIILINLIFGEIVLSTEKRHQLTGYAEKYLGKFGKYFMFALVLFSFYGALLAYTIGEGEVLSTLFGGQAFWWSILFIAVGSIFIFFGLKLIKKIEVWLTAILLLIILFICFKGFNFIDLENLKTVSWSLFLVPYGVIFFAMGGLSAIPQMKDVLLEQKKQLKKAIIWGTTLPFLFYALFVFTTIGVTGAFTTDIATIGLGQVLGRTVLIAGNVLAFFTMITSFFIMGLGLKTSYQFDFGLKNFSAWLLVISVPLIAFVLGVNNFNTIIGTVGSIGSGLQGLLICLMFLRLKKYRDRVPEYELPKSRALIIILSAVFLFGAIIAVVPILGKF